MHQNSPLLFLIRFMKQLSMSSQHADAISWIRKKRRKSVRQSLINGALNAKIVGQSAFRDCRLADVTVPVRTKILIGEVTSVDFQEEFAP